MSSHRIRTLIRVSLILSIFLGCRQSLLRADVTATMLGIVRDSSLAAVSGVKVTAVNLDTNLTQIAVTDAKGEYRIQALPVGRYNIEAELTGFEKFVAGNVVANRK